MQCRLAPGRLISVSDSRHKDIVLIFTQNLDSGKFSFVDRCTSYLQSEVNMRNKQLNLSKDFEAY